MPSVRMLCPSEETKQPWLEPSETICQSKSVNLFHSGIWPQNENNNYYAPLSFGMLLFAAKARLTDTEHCFSLFV